MDCGLGMAFFGGGIMISTASPNRALSKSTGRCAVVGTVRYKPGDRTCQSDLIDQAASVGSPTSSSVKSEQTISPVTRFRPSVKFTPPFAFGLYIILALQPLTLIEQPMQTRTVDGQVDRICYFDFGPCRKAQTTPSALTGSRNQELKFPASISFDMLRISPWVWRSGNL